MKSILKKKRGDYYVNNDYYQRISKKLSPLEKIQLRIQKCREKKKKERMDRYKEFEHKVKKV